MKLTAKQWKSILFSLNKIHILVIILPTSKFITNRGCIRINYRNIDIVQIIQRN